MQSRAYHVVGTSVPRVDGWAKVAGHALYTDDMSVPGMLHAGCVHSRMPHATVEVDVSAALEVPGVVCALVESDFPKPQSSYDWYYCTSHPRMTGDVLAVVAATSRAALERGIAAVRVRYHELPGVFSLDEALSPDAPQVRDRGVGLVDGVPDASRAGNVFLESYRPVRKGDVEKGFSEADVVVERRYETGYAEHAYLEPESVLVIPQGDGSYVVRSCSQHGHTPQEFVADALRIPMSRVRAVSSVVGGSFGSKFELVGLMCGRAALVSQLTGRPCKMTYSREDSILESTKRHPFRSTIRIGATSDGRLVAYEATQVENAGAYNNQAPWMNIRAAAHSAGPYEIPNVRTDTYAVYTNNPVPGAFRGYSSPQVIYTNEMAVLELAHELSRDVVDLKRQNLLRRGSVTATGQRLVHETLLVRLMDDLVADTDYRRKAREWPCERGVWRRGIGLVTSYRGVALGGESVDASGTLMVCLPDGSLVVRPALMEFGQGLQTVYAQIASEATGIALSDIRLGAVDTTVVADSGLTVASRGTAQGGQSVRLAGEAIRGMLLETAREMLGATADEEIDLRDGCCLVVRQPERSVSVADVARARRYAGLPLETYQWYTPRPLENDSSTGQGEAFTTYAYGACVCEVSVNTHTGRVVVDRVSAYHDVGHALNPELVRGQIYGGIVMGLGYGLWEDVGLDHGHMHADNLDAYLVGTSGDVPRMNVRLYECDDPEGTYGAKCIAEAGSEMVGAAAVLAVSHAVGCPLRCIPVTPEAVLDALDRGGEV